DDLTGVLDDGIVVGIPTATTGLASYESPVIRWSGDLDPGEAVTVTYRIRTMAGGDGQLDNSVVSNDVGSNCPDGSDATECVTVANLVAPPSTPSTTVPPTTVPPIGPLPGTGSDTARTLQVTVLLLLSGGLL